MLKPAAAARWSRLQRRADVFQLLRPGLRLFYGQTRDVGMEKLGNTTVAAG